MALHTDVEKVLVTGATGYVATHIIHQLQGAGYKVRGAVRSVTDRGKLEPLEQLCRSTAHDLELVEADFSSTQPDCWKDAVRGCSHVVHTAPSPLTSLDGDDDDDDEDDEGGDEIVDPLIDGTIRILQACAEVGGVRRVVLTSSCAAISNLRENNEEPITESTWRSLECLMEQDEFGKGIALAEKAAWDFVERLPVEYRFELAVINPTVVLGPVLSSEPGPSVEYIRRILERDSSMVPRLNLACCDVRDVAKAHVVAMTLPEAAGHRHIICSGNLWMLEMANILAEEFRDKGYNPPSKVAPNFLFKIMAWFDSDTRYIASLLGYETRFSDTRMREVLGITPHDIRDTVIDMAYSCIDCGYIAKTDGYSNDGHQGHGALQGVEEGKEVGVDEAVDKVNDEGIRADNEGNHDDGSREKVDGDGAEGLDDDNEERSQDRVDAKKGEGVDDEGEEEEKEEEVNRENEEEVNVGGGEKFDEECEEKTDEGPREGVDGGGGEGIV